MFSLQKHYATRYIRQLNPLLRQYSSDKLSILKQLEIKEENCGVYGGEWFGNGPILDSINPADNTEIASVRSGNHNDYQKVIEAMNAAKPLWAQTPAPLRGEVVRQIGDEMRRNKNALGAIIALEMGKIMVEVLNNRENRSVMPYQ